jgi:hypothetical protein
MGPASIEGHYDEAVSVIGLPKAYTGSLSRFAPAGKSSVNK